MHKNPFATAVAAATGGFMLAAVLASPASAATARFGPTGYDGVRLGMSYKQAKATGRLKLTPFGRHARCTAGTFKGHPSAFATISRKYGVILLNAPKTARTPRGVGDGSTYKQFKKAYPHLRYEGDPYDFQIILSKRPLTFYRLSFIHGKAADLQLQRMPQDCFE